LKLFQQKKFQKGVALLTALVVMSLATITAVSMTKDQRIYVRRTENIILHEQIYLYLLSAEDLAKTVLAEDEDASVDSKLEDWYTISQDRPEFAIEAGTFSAALEDMQAKLNLNNFSRQPPNQWDVDRLRQALSIYSIKPEIADVIMDWIDENQNARSGGAEDVDYLGGDRPYRTADNNMGSISELKLLKGIDQDIYEKLAGKNGVGGVLTVIPNADNATININTASAEVLRMITGLSESDAIELEDDLANNPLNAPADLLDHPLVKGSPNVSNLTDQGLSVETHYFILRSRANVSRAHSSMISIINRISKTDIKVVMRIQGKL